MYCESLLFAWSNIIKWVGSSGFSELGIVLVMIREAGVVENEQRNFVSISPEIFVVTLGSLRYIAQAIRRNAENCV